MYLRKSTFSKSSCDLRISSAVLLLFILNTTKTPRDLLRQNRYGIHDLLYLTSLTLEAVAPGEKTVNVIFRKHEIYLHHSTTTAVAVLWTLELSAGSQLRTWRVFLFDKFSCFISCTKTSNSPPGQTWEKFLGLFFLSCSSSKPLRLPTWLLYLSSRTSMMSWEGRSEIN